MGMSSQEPKVGWFGCGSAVGGLAAAYKRPGDARLARKDLSSQEPKVGWLECCFGAVRWSPGCGWVLQA